MDGQERGTIVHTAFQGVKVSDSVSTVCDVHVRFPQNTESLAAAWPASEAVVTCCDNSMSYYTLVNTDFVSCVRVLTAQLRCC